MSAGGWTRHGRTILWILAGAVVGGFCAGVLSLAGIAFFGVEADTSLGNQVSHSILPAGVVTGWLVGAALGWRAARLTWDAVPPGHRVAHLGLAMRLCLTVFGMLGGGTILGAAACALGLVYLDRFPLHANAGGAGLTIFLVVLPIGVVAGWIVGAVMTWRLSGRPFHRGDVTR